MSTKFISRVNSVPADGSHWVQRSLTSIGIAADHIHLCSKMSEKGEIAQEPRV